MCGFVGYLGFNRNPDVNEIIPMSEVIGHRGPDDAEVFVDGPVAMAFRRLSIIDIDYGKQPMSSKDGRFTLVFNGEIYNYIELREELQRQGYTFLTTSDTEVLLTMYIHYGNDFLQYLNGMFALALWDKTEQKLFIARDRLGIKPLYYMKDHDKFIFGSEIKSIIAHKSVHREANYEAIADYLSYGYTTDDKTFFKGIYKLFPGYYGVISKTGGLKVQQYWDLEYRFSDEPEQQLIGEMRYVIEDAVRLHTRSDVPIGCHLSGGLDSSTVTCLARKYAGQTIKTFTGRFQEGTYYDESHYAKHVAAETDSDYQEVTIGIDSLNQFHKILWFMDEPVVGPGVIPQFSVCNLASNHVKVVLGGQGGDELFAGYHRYFIVYDQLKNLKQDGDGQQNLKASPLSKLHRNFELVKNHFIQYGLVSTFMRVLRKVNEDMDAPNNFEELWHRQNLFIPTDSPLLSDKFRMELNKYNPKENFLRWIRKVNSADPLYQMLYHDIKSYLPGLLHVEDRTSMAHSLESRVPLLDYRIVEKAAAIPVHIKVKNLEMKYFFKKVIEPYIPKRILDRKDKKGFPTPLKRWFELKPEFVQEILLDDRTHKRGLFQLEYIMRLMGSKEDHSWELWSLLNVELWFKIFIDQDPRYVDSNGVILDKVEL